MSGTRIRIPSADFLSNGYATEFVDGENGPSRPVGGVFSQDDLQRIMNRRREAIDPRTVPVNEKVAGRYYQIEAIKAFCDNLWKGKRRGLLVMATGTGKPAYPPHLPTCSCARGL